MHLVYAYRRSRHRVVAWFSNGLELEVAIPRMTPMKWIGARASNVRVVDGRAVIETDAGPREFSAVQLSRMRVRVIRPKFRPPPFEVANTPPPVRGEQVVTVRSAALAVGRSVSGMRGNMDRVLRPTRAANGLRLYDIERIAWWQMIAANALWNLR